MTTEPGSDAQFAALADTSAIGRAHRAERWRAFFEEVRTRLTAVADDPGVDYPDPDEAPPDDEPHDEYNPLPE